MGVEIIDYEGAKFNDGMNVEIIDTIKIPNADTSKLATTLENSANTSNADTTAPTTPFVSECIEPSIIYQNQLLHKARIIKAISDEDLQNLNANSGENSQNINQNLQENSQNLQNANTQNISVSTSKTNAQETNENSQNPSTNSGKTSENSQENSQTPNLSEKNSREINENSQENSKENPQNS